MEVGCLRHPGASTIGSQLLYEDRSHGLQMHPHTKMEPGSPHTELTVEQWREERGNAWRCAPMQDNADCKCYYCEGWRSGRAGSWLDVQVFSDKDYKP